MLLELPQVLTPTELQQIREGLRRAEWADGRHTAGYLSRAVKDNEQVPDTHPVALELGEMILRVLEGNAPFTSATLPIKIVPPLFNRYRAGRHYGSHIDGAIRPITSTPHRVRTDISATLFLSDPQDYEGGELVIEGSFGRRAVKLAAGDMVLYPGTSVHHVAPVTYGERYAVFFWIQSMVRLDLQRQILFDLDTSIQDLAEALPDHPLLVRLAGVYHNLLRCWADT